MENKGKRDPINFFYGLGAAIILLAALAKFQGSRWADTLFTVGLVGEAIIFLIAGLQRVQKTNTYDWDKVFPQLSKTGEDVMIPMGTAKVTQEQQVKEIIDSISTLNSTVDNLNLATKKLVNSVGKLEDNFERVSDSTIDYQQEINSLKIKISAANKRLKEFENFKF
jgi:peptidoglycan hydrolase CwlO-like protein